MDYSIKQLRLKVMDCIENIITSKELGTFAYDAWYHVNEGKNPDQGYLDILLELSSEWGFLSAAHPNGEFQKGFLKSLLERIEKYTNIEESASDFDKNLL